MERDSGSIKKIIKNETEVRFQSLGVGLLKKMKFAIQKISEHKGGFSIVELLVSVSIIAMFAGIFLTNYHGANTKSQVVMAAQKLATDIRLAQNYSLSAKDFTSGTPVPGGWGMHFTTVNPNNNIYIMWADNNGNGNYSPLELYSTINLPSGITITKIVSNGSNSNASDLLFIPPNPTIRVNNTNNGSMNITISDISGNSKIVSIDNMGLIEVN